MKKFLPSLLVTLLFSHAAFSDGPPSADVAALRQKIAPHRAEIEKGTAVARTLKLRLRGGLHEISFAECKSLEKKIEALYPLSPFHAVYKDGSAYSQFCDWNPEYPEPSEAQGDASLKMHYFLDSATDSNQLGVSAAYRVRIEKPWSGWPKSMQNPGELEFLLDNEYKIIERTTRSSDGRGKTIDWDSVSLDSKGNYFYFIGNGDGAGHGGFQRAFYASADGTLYGGWIQGPRRMDKGSETIITHIFKVQRKDWQDFSLIPTHWMGRYFQYSPGEWVNWPNNADLLDEVQLADSGKEVCADGTSWVGNVYTRYKPTDNHDPWSCANIW